jgi:hypothetical protein
MIKVKHRKHLKTLAAIALFLIILGIVFNVNNYLMAALIGIFVVSIAQIFIHKK